MNKDELIEILQEMDGKDVLIDIPECGQYKEIYAIKPAGTQIHIVTERLVIDANLKIN